MGIYDYSVQDEEGCDVSLSKFKGKVMLIVNTATDCGFTPHYKELEEIYEKYLNTKTRQGFALQRKAVERLRFYLEGKLAVTYVDDKDEEYMNISKGDSDGIVNVIRDIEGVELAIFLREDKGNTKASVRSKNSIEYISSREFANIYGRRSDIKDLEDLE